MTDSNVLNTTDSQRLQYGSRPGLLSRLTYRLLRCLVVRPVFRWVLSGHVDGCPPNREDGPYVVVANHGSYLDPPLLSCAMGYPVAFMAKQELFSVPLLGRLIRGLGAIPVRRGAVDRRAIDRCLKRLLQGWWVGIFLDGTRSHSGAVMRPRHGAALLAAQSGCPLLTVAIIGSRNAMGRDSRRLRRVPVTIRIGPVLPAPEDSRRASLEATTRRCAMIINGLLDGQDLSPAQATARVSDRGQ